MSFQIDEYLTPGVIRKFRPYRNIFVFIAVVAIFFAVLIIVENIIFISIVSKQSVFLLLLPYLLSWILIFLGACFAKFAYLLYSRDKNKINNNNNRSFGSVLPLHTTSLGWSTDDLISTTSRPITPESLHDSTPLPYNPLLFRNSLTVPTSPFFITDTSTMTYRDQPPAYADVVDRGVSPIPSHKLNVE